MRHSFDWIRALAFIVATRASAQQVQGSVTIAGGSATDVIGTTSRALSVSPALSFTPDPRLVLGLGGTGTRYDDQRWSLGGQASAAGRIPVTSHVALTLNADGGATGTSYDFSYVTATALPAIEVAVGAVTGFAGASAAAASTKLTRTIPGAPGLFGGIPLGSSSTSSSSRTWRSSRGMLFGGNARFSDANGDNVVLGVRQQNAAVDTISMVDRSASAATSNGRLTIGATIGVRDEQRTNTTFGSGMLSVAVDPRLAIQLAGGSYPPDRLLGTQGGRFMTLGVSITTGRAERHLPSTSGVPAPDAGVTRVTIRGGDARKVEIAGDFSHWKPIAATRAPNGVWYADLRLPPGQYRYAFRIDGAAWAVPDGAPTVNDGFGGKAAWLTVSDAPNGSAR